jgi:hypothetical protein
MRLLALLPLLALAVAGCLGASEVPTMEVLPDRPLGRSGWSQVCEDGADWADLCSVRATPALGPANENWLAVNPTNPDNLVVGTKNYDDASSSCVWGGVHVTFDAGRTWEERPFGGTQAERMARGPADPLFGYQCMTDPMFAFDAQGLLYYVVEVYGRTPHEREGLLPAPPTGTGLEGLLTHPDTGGGALLVAVSEDGGRTFPRMVKLWDGEGGILDLLDKTFILANPASGTIHFATSQFVALGQATQILVFNSRDQGRTWEGPIVLGDPSQTGTRFPAAFSADADGTLHLTWADTSTGAIQFTRSLDDGSTWEEPRPIATSSFVFRAPPNSQYRAVTQPYHVVDRSGGPNHGTIYLVWMDDAEGHMDIRITTSRDRGLTWAAPRTFTDDATTNAQFHPMPWVDDQGAVHVTYYDRRHDPQDKLVDLTWAIAPDGSNFTHHRITGSGFDGDLGIHQDGFPFLGDYNGLGCVGSVCYAAWADTRMGRGDVAVARLVRG